MINSAIKYLYIIVIVAGFSLKAVGQGVAVSTDLQDVRYAGKTYNNLKGSPFLFDDYVEGSVTLNDCAEYRDLKLNFDQIKEEVFFILNTRMQAFAHPVRQFTVGKPNTPEHRVFRNGFSPMDGETENSFYEVLIDNEVSLIKRVSKSIVEERANGQTFKTKQIKSITRYYIGQGTTLMRAPKDKKTFLSILPDQTKTAQIEGFLTENKLSLKDEQGLVKIISFYNSLN